MGFLGVHWLAAIGAMLLTTSSVSALVITEIHYHPSGSGDLARRSEFIEIYNEDSDPRDVTQFALTNSISFTIAPRTILQGRSYLVICADEDLIQARYGITNTVGNWSAAQSLDNGGERVTFSNPGGALVTTVAYNDRGRWNAGADGTGHSLALIDPYTDIDDPDNWALSLERGGTPGTPNFPSGHTPATVVFNEGLINTAGPRWVELYNNTDAEIDLSGLYLSDDRENLAKSQIPGGTMIQGGDWLTFEDTAIGLDFALALPLGDRIFVSLYDQGTDRVLDAFTFRPNTLIPETAETSEARFPDGDAYVAPSADPTRGAVNAVTAEDDVVISEINYHPLKEDPNLEFIELCNRNPTDPVDLTGWSFDRGVNFAIPGGTMLTPGECLIVARNPARFTEVYGAGITVIGPAQDQTTLALFGVLRNTGERIRLLDPRGNIADTVSYGDGGEWPRWADGKGSTLELIDLWQDNSSPQSWDASDDSDKAEVRFFEYSARHNDAFGDPDGNFGVTPSEIHVMNLDRGIALVDDLEIPGAASNTQIIVDVPLEIGGVWEYWKGQSEPPSDWKQPQAQDGLGPFLRGDCNGNGTVAGDLADPLLLLFFSFGGGATPPCMAACDANSDGLAGGDTSDAVFLLMMNYLAGPTPASPFPACGFSELPADLALGCDVTTDCGQSGSSLVGTTPFGYGETDLGTDLTDMRNGYLSVFARTTFEMPELTADQRLVLEMDYDDGYVLYIDGAEVARDNINGNPPSFNEEAPANREKGSIQTIDLTNRNFASGSHVFAVQIHNRRINSTDLWLAPRLLVVRLEELPAGWNTVPNGDFEQDLDDEWIRQGTHLRSGITRDDPITGSGSLKLVASGSADQKVNRVESELLGALTVGQTHTVRFNARWVVGSQSIHTQGFGFGLATDSHDLHVPEDLGTPGAQNSVALRQIERVGSPNLGPVIDLVSQDPVYPSSGESVTVRARIRDSDGVTSAAVRFAIGRATAAFTEVAMNGPDERDFFTAVIPGQSQNAIVIFEVVATDGGGFDGRFPRDRTRQTHPLLADPDNAAPVDRGWAMYGHGTRPNSSNHDFKIWMDRDSESFLYSRPVHSNDYLEASVVFEDQAIYHGCGFRFQGSFLSRGTSQFRVRMPGDRPLHGRIPRFNLDRDGFNVRDRLVNYLIRWNNVQGMKAPYVEGTIARAGLNSRFSGSVFDMKEPPGSRMLDDWFPGDDDGILFEMDERSDLNDVSERASNRLSARWQYPPYDLNTFFLTGPQEEQSYRYFFNLRTDKGVDDYTEIIDTARFLDPGATGNASFDAEVFDRFRVEEFLRVLAVRQNCGDFDTWACIFGRSAYCYRGKVDEGWRLLPWDSDSSFGADGRSLTTLLIPANPLAVHSNGFDEIERMLNRPAVKRCLYAVLQGMVDQQFDPEFLDPYLDAMSAFGSQETSRGRPGGFVDQRAQLIRANLESSVFPQQTLVITTNGGAGFAAGSSSVSLEGTAPVEVKFLVVVRNGGEIPAEEGSPEVEFSTTDIYGWSMSGIPLASGVNELEILGMDSSGSIVDTEAISVTAP